MKCEPSITIRRAPRDDVMLVAEVDGDVVGNLGMRLAAKSPRRRHAGAIGMSRRAPGLRGAFPLVAERKGTKTAPKRPPQKNR